MATEAQRRTQAILNEFVARGVGARAAGGSLQRRRACRRCLGGDRRSGHWPAGRL